MFASWGGTAGVDFWPEIYTANSAGMAIWQPLLLHVLPPLLQLLQFLPGHGEG